MILAVGTDAQFQQLCRVLNEYCVDDDDDEESLSLLWNDERFKTNTMRVQHNDALKVHLQRAIGKIERNELLSRLNEASVPAGAVRTMDEVFGLPGVKESMVLEGQLPNGDTIRGVRAISFVDSSPLPSLHHYHHDDTNMKVSTRSPAVVVSP
eukprot:CAMPEP_0118714020 /NCGR_PEP_ID=MMETSP0800-20121206/25904_1 /TAXON_ID=210618 ORGANISM="Striatella unipunctata, Strain CCMP2910" /NCGR_SAMPLE_ID=MMETSP0800 /ASSEMBLY_ACC=CAM_ASM_000638 /LENGTH=152 /DNA_ID=CAMNT_0006619665 /DNA_START=152 /DNA_END=607 /DNA_ORIENTATION=+